MKNLSRTQIYLRGIIIGALFGLILEKSKVYHPGIIRTQFHFTTFTMAIMMLMAAGVGLFVMSIYHILTKKQQATSSGSLSFMGNSAGNLIGGSILGLGMYICGADPGTVIVQMATGLNNSYTTFLGMILGSYVFSYLHTKLFGTKLDQKTASARIITSIGVPHMVLGVVLITTIAALAMTIDWRAEQSLACTSFEGTKMTHFPHLDSVSWHPLTAGSLLGLLNIPAEVLVGACLGTSAAYMLLLSFVMPLINKNWRSHLPVIGRYQGSTEHFQLAVVLGIYAGAMLSSYLSGIIMLNKSVVTVTEALIGGAMVSMGARLAAGCPSSHGVSGLAHGDVSSYATMAGMLGGGVLGTLVY